MDLEIEKAVIAVFEEYNEVIAVFLIGSTASGNSRPDSDIDLAVLTDGGKSLNPVTRVNIANLLSYQLSKPVDLGQISSENLVFAREALLKGHPILVRDEERMNMIRANLLGMYIQYNLDRKEVVDAYITR
ncbi:MAG: nucleotidyltransferase domain-containing protein [Spirochaetia bacterium]|nr:nucleotidyltransferase domain-containing protein [Spirochaetia bacterium]